MAVPRPGEELEFAPDTGLQPIHYLRPVLSGTQERVRRTAVDAAESEAAEALAVWTVAALAGVLSLENILLVLTCTPPAHSASIPPSHGCAAVYTSSCHSRLHLAYMSD